MPNNKLAQPQQNQNKEKAAGEQEQHRRRRRRSRGGQGNSQQGQAAAKTAQQTQGKNAPAAEKNAPAKKGRGGQNSGQNSAQNVSQNNGRRQPQAAGDEAPGGWEGEKVLIFYRFKQLHGHRRHGKCRDQGPYIPVHQVGEKTPPQSCQIFHNFSPYRVT